MSSAMQHALSFGGIFKNAPSPLEELQTATRLRCQEIEVMADLQREMVRLKEKNTALEALVQSVVDALPMAVWAKDLGADGSGKNGRFIFTNSTCRSILGAASVDDTLGYPYTTFNLDADDGRATFLTACEATDRIMFSRNEKATPHDYHIHNSLDCGYIGEDFVRYVATRAPLFRRGAMVGLVCSSRDVTKDYETLAGAKELLSKVVELQEINNCAGPPTCHEALGQLTRHLMEYEFFSELG